MKKFNFSLAAVLGFKEQVLEDKKLELAEAVQAVMEKEKWIKRLERECTAVIGEFNRKKLEGMTVIDAQSYEIHVNVLYKAIEDEHEKLAHLREEETKKQREVILAKQEVSSLENLRDRKLEEYNKAVRKEEELLIDELVSNKRAIALAEANSG